MAHVSVTINGRQYRMACDDGQEHHLARLAHDLDQRISNLRAAFGEIGDLRLTIMAALIAIDELSEQRQRLHRIETELTSLQHARAAAADRADAIEADMVAALTSAAERIEKAVRLFEQADEAPQAAIG
ncbi:MAG TPA: cell division protein ZapA [Xanthobacteraceae bacterium]|jgi:cell division protein ZapA|nr:cell division protein ZapA [Xanthobacteraceae bacterium]